MDRELFTKFLGYYNTLIELHGKQFELNKNLRDKILTRDLEQITSTTHTIDLVTAEIETVEVERRKVIYELYPNKSISNGLKSIISELEDDDTEMINKSRDSLKEIVLKVSRINEGNHIIIQENLSDIKSIVNMVIESKRPKAGYDLFGKSSGSAINKTLLNRVG